MSHVAALSPAVPKPAHVPEALVYDFDMVLDPAYVANPHDRILDLQKNAPPVFWTPRRGGHWMLIGHAANFKASRDWETFSSEVFPRSQLAAMMSQLPKDIGHIPTAVPINIDPPAHGIFRAPLQAAFSPKAALALADSIRTLARELIDKVAAQGRCEFMADIAEPLPVQVFLKVLGLPLERQAEYRELVKDQLASSGTNDIMVSIRKLQHLASVMRPTMIERRENPKDDMISVLWKSQIDGRPVTLEDMENYGVLLFIAGLDTVMNGMGHGIRHLAQDLPLQYQLRQNPKLITDAKEELLRRYTFTVPVRRVAKDVELEGAPMKAGDRAMLFLPGADLDAAEFPNPEKFDLKRENNVNISFNTGPHRCLGSHLARVELQILYEEMLARLPQFRLDPNDPPTFHCGNIIGVDRLSLVWDA
jgi:cytochrome P450